MEKTIRPLFTDRVTNTVNMYYFNYNCLLSKFEFTTLHCLIPKKQNILTMSNIHIVFMVKCCGYVVKCENHKFSVYCVPHSSVERPKKLTRHTVSILTGRKKTQFSHLCSSAGADPRGGGGGGFGG